MPFSATTLNSGTLIKGSPATGGWMWSDATCPAISSQALELCHASRGDPFGDEDVSFVIEAGVVRVNKFSGGFVPAVRLGAHFVAAFGDFSAPGFVIAEMRDEFVIAVEQRHAS